MSTVSHARSLNYEHSHGDAGSDEVDTEATLLLVHGGSDDKDVHGGHGGASEFSAVWNIVCTIAGVGILSLPKAMADGGWVATIVLVLSAVIADYTGKLLIEAMYAGRDGTRLAGGFPEIGYAAYGNTGYYLVQFFHKTTLVGVCTLFLILAGDYVNSIIHYFAGQYVLSPTLWSLFIGVVVWVPLVTLKTVKEVAFVSLVGVLASIIVVIVVLQQALWDYNTNDLQPAHDTFVLATFPTAFASMAFAYGGSAVYPHVEQSMKEPKKFNRAITISMLAVMAMYVPTAIVGYYVYGSASQSPILASLPEGVPVLLAEIFITLHVILAYPMPMMAVVLDLEPYIHKYTKQLLAKQDYPSPSVVGWTEWSIRAMARTSIVAITIIIAVSLGSQFGLFFDLVASFGNTALIFILPIVFYWKLHGFHNVHIAHKVIGMVVILMGFLAGGIGTYMAMDALIKSGQQEVVEPTQPTLF